MPQERRGGERGEHWDTPRLPGWVDLERKKAGKRAGKGRKGPVSPEFYQKSKDFICKRD